MNNKMLSSYEPMDLILTDEESGILAAMCLYCSKQFVTGDEITAYPIGPLKEEDAYRKVRGEEHNVTNYCLHKKCALLWAGFPLPEPVTDMRLDQIMIKQNVEKWESYITQSEGPREIMIDIGCYDGQYIRAAFFSGFKRVVGIDINPDFFRTIIDWKEQYYPNRHLTLMNTRINTPRSFIRVLRFFGKTIDFLKVDIEGNEYTAMVEAIDQWSPHVRYMNVEMHELHPIRPEHGVITPPALEEVFRKNNWKRLGDRDVIDSTWVNEGR